MEPFIDLQTLKARGLYPESFSEELAPIRYHKLKKELLAMGYLDEYALVIHGVRRSGKTYAGIKLGELSEKYGYRFLYYEVTPGDEYFNPYHSAEVSAKLIEEIKGGSKLFIMLDEAFNTPVYTRKVFLEPFRGVYEKIVKRSIEGRFFILFSGSYLYDPIKISAYIRRVFGRQRRTGLITLPRLKPIESLSEPNEALLKRISSNPSYFDLESLRSLIDLSEGSLIRFQKKTLGMPSVIEGIEMPEDVIGSFLTLMRESFSMDIDLREKIDKKIEMKSIDFVEVAKRISQLLENQKRRGKTKGDLLDILALFTGLLLPRRYIRKEEFENIDTLIERLKNHSIEDFYTRATPSSIFSLEALKKIIASYSEGSFSIGSFYEALIAHALLMNAIFYENDLEGYIHNIPIFSTAAIDFIYVSPKDPKVFFLIEVKRSLSYREEIIKSIIKASQLGGILYIATTDVPDIGVRRYKIKPHSKDGGYRASISRYSVEIEKKDFKISYEVENPEYMEILRDAAREASFRDIIPPIFINVELLAEALGVTLLKKSPLPQE